MSLAALKAAVSKQHHAHRIAYPRTAYGEGHRAQPIQLVSPACVTGKWKGPLQQDGKSIRCEYQNQGWIKAVSV